MYSIIASILLFTIIITAVCYRGAKAYDKAVEMFDRAADAYYKNHAYPYLCVFSYSCMCGVSPLPLF